MKKSGHADLPLHYGRVPIWLADRMSLLSGAIVESILEDYGKKVLIERFSDPFWFQSLGAVLGMDWHSSGITTSVMGALKKSLQGKSKEFGIYVCGGRGKHSRKTPDELMRVGELTGIDGASLARSSRLTAKVDSNAVQDGFQIYLHSFIVSDEGNWAVVQQGMNTDSGYARRYHWHSDDLQSFVTEPHSFVVGENQGEILNLTAREAKPTQSALIGLSAQHPDKVTREIRKLILPAHHDVRLENVDLKRLGTVLHLAHESEVKEFDDLLLTPGLGPRTLQSLTLVSEVIHGTKSRFSDPARFSFAHGGKDGHPFPVPLKVYDQTIAVLKKAIQKGKLGQTEKRDALKRLHKNAAQMEKHFSPDTEKFDDIAKKEWQNKKLYGGRTVFDNAQKKRRKISPDDSQLSLF